MFDAIVLDFDSNLELSTPRVDFKTVELQLLIPFNYQTQNTFDTIKLLAFDC